MLHLAAIQIAKIATKIANVAPHLLANNPVNRLVNKFALKRLGQAITCPRI